MSAGVAQRSAPWQVLVVEDDPVIASVYRRTVKSVDGLEVAGTVCRGEDALALLNRQHCDLLLLDLKLSGMSGLALLQKLRTSGYPIEAIALTACRNSGTVRALVQRGAIDYLVKPFPIERLRQSLARFLYRASALRNEELDQAAVDQACAAGRVSKRWLPKGLTQDGVASVRGALEVQRQGASSSDVADATGLARVTARRYLEYLVVTEQASVEALPNGPGRPRKVYRPLAA
jgi:two-component system, CitB family, response regulator DctR